MALTTTLQVFLAGLAGGAILALLHWYTIRKDGKWPDYAHSPIYWVTSALMAVVGGGLAVLYFGGRAEGIIAAHVGLSAPLILQKLTTTIAATGAKSGGLRITTFFHW